MSDDKQSPFEQAAAFQKSWMESMSKMAQAAFSATPETVPPEILKQMRNGIFEALAKSWEEFMRSPQFLEAVKQMMDKAIAFKRLTAEMLTKAHHELQGSARTDMDAILVAIRHLESRIIDRMDELEQRVSQVEKDKGARPATPKSRKTKSARRQSRPS